MENTEQRYSRHSNLTVRHREPPCFPACEERTVGCHANCEKYLQWKQELSQKKEVRRAERKAEYNMTSYEIGRICNVKDRTRKKGR